MRRGDAPLRCAGRRGPRSSSRPRGPRRGGRGPAAGGAPLTDALSAAGEEPVPSPAALTCCRGSNSARGRSAGSASGPDPFPDPFSELQIRIHLGTLSPGPRRVLTCAAGFSRTVSFPPYLPHFGCPLMKLLPRSARWRPVPHLPPPLARPSRPPGPVRLTSPARPPCAVLCPHTAATGQVLGTFHSESLCKSTLTRYMDGGPSGTEVISHGTCKSPESKQG